MKTTRGFTIVFAVFAVFAFFSAQPRASLIVGFDISGDITASGFFEFDQLSGTLRNNLLDMSFSGSIFGNPFTYSLTDPLVTIPSFLSNDAYSIDPISGVLSFGTFRFDGQVATPTLNVFVEDPIFSGGSGAVRMRCQNPGGTSCDGSNGSIARADASFDPVALPRPVPEPSSGALFFIGLGAIALVARRRRPRSAGWIRPHAPFSLLLVHLPTARPSAPPAHIHPKPEGAIGSLRRLLIKPSNEWKRITRGLSVQIRKLSEAQA